MPIFQAQPRANDGKMPEWDLILQMATTIALEFPPAEQVKSVRLTFRWKGSPTVRLVWKALLKKHLATIDSHGNPRDATKTAREIILNILVHKSDWKPYAAIFAAFAERNDRDFFEQLVRGIQRKRKKVFADEEWFLLLNWEEWNNPLPPELLRLPPLTFWTDEAILGLLERLAPEGIFRLNLSGLRTKRIRLGLEQAKPAKVIGIFPVDGRPAFFNVETTD